MTNSLLGQTLRFAFQDKHDVEVASSGREALDLLARDSDFDLVLCDLMMPDVSGEHVYRAVTEQAPGLLPRFVFMTGGAFTERAQEFLAHFAGRQLEKPFNIDEVEVLLSELSRRRRRLKRRQRRQALVTAHRQHDRTTERRADDAERLRDRHVGDAGSEHFGANEAEHQRERRLEVVKALDEIGEHEVQRA